MEPLTRESKIFEYFPICLVIAVYFVSQNRKSYRREMDSDLVGATREEVHFEKRVLIMKNSLIAKLCFSEFGINRIDSCHFLPVIRITSDEGFDMSLLVFCETIHEG